MLTSVRDSLPSLLASACRNKSRSVSVLAQEDSRAVASAERWRACDFMG